MDFLWASSRGITRKPVVGTAGLLFSPVTSRLVPPDFLRAKAFRPNGGIRVVDLYATGEASENLHRRPAGSGR